MVAHSRAKDRLLPESALYFSLMAIDGPSTKSTGTKPNTNYRVSDFCLSYIVRQVHLSAQHLHTTSTSWLTDPLFVAISLVTDVMSNVVVAT